MSLTEAYAFSKMLFVITFTFKTETSRFGG